MNASALREDIARIPAPLKERLERSGFDAERLISLAGPLFARQAGGVGRLAEERNRVEGRVELPGERDVPDAPIAGTASYDRCSAVGLEALSRGQLAFCVLAGGMATRMGGVVKALVEALEGCTFLEARLRENAAWSARAGVAIPLWLMTSEATDQPIRQALERAGAPPHVTTFLQDLNVRLTPEGRLFLDDGGNPSTYAPGHGDLPDALRRSGLLASFVERGGRYVWIANLDNLGATIDAPLLGDFIERRCDLRVELAAKETGDRGGVPVWADATDQSGHAARRLQVLEEFRLPRGFDAARVQVFNTNTFLVRADLLLNATVQRGWFEVEKQVGGRTAVQFERLLQELTSTHAAAYVRVPRGGAESRFLPAKDYDELSRRREQIRAVALARGML